MQWTYRDVEALPRDVYQVLVEWLNAEAADRRAALDDDAWR